MALEQRPQGSVWPSLLITWELDGGGVAQLTGAALSGWLRNRATGARRAIAGQLTVVDGAAGKFRWDLDAADVAEAGEFDVQFRAAFDDGPSPGLSYLGRWKVTGSIVAGD